MRGVFMEKTIYKVKTPIFFVVVIVLVLTALALGAYYFLAGSQNKQPSKGTYVYIQSLKEHEL